uniref:tripartite tricarboxylate transporter permease n=1 Tax=Pararhizobium sp. IMCC3301 TaxID=3067904 RepID=UPI0027418CA0|nr:tripartite tricarboxylate transporter permease [Pararhizobium sp. IMCC3301]
MILDLLASFGSMLQPGPFILIFVGVLSGIVVGAIPGLNGAMLVALSLPLTYGWEPLDGVALLVGQYVGSIAGGLVSATLLSIPGSASSMMTTLDAAPMAQKGRPDRALQLGIIASFIGGLVSWLALVFLSPPLAKLALKFGPHEYFALVLAALMLISSLSEGSMIKALLSACLGMLVAIPGIDTITAQPRLTFGLPQMNAGFSLLAVLLGIFAITQLLADSANTGDGAKRLKLGAKMSWVKVSDFTSQWFNVIRSSLIGTWIGILPGVGGSVGAIVSYVTAKNSSKTPEMFGTGCDEGIVASEAANSATVGGALIPMITMGIPGSIIDVILIAALTLHSVRPGPLLFQNEPEIVYGFMSVMFIANLLMLVLMLAGIRFFAKLIDLPSRYLVPVLLLLCVVGAYAVNNRVFDIWVMFAFGLLGLLFRAWKIPVAPFVIGFILTPIAERNFRTALIISENNLADFLTRPITLIFLIVSIAVLFMPLISKRRQRSGTAI